MPVQDKNLFQTSVNTAGSFAGNPINKQSSVSQRYLAVLFKDRFELLDP